MEARSVAGCSRTAQLAHGRGPAAAAAQEVAGAGGPQESPGRHMEMPDAVQGGGLDHDPPSVFMVPI